MKQSQFIYEALHIATTMPAVRFYSVLGVAFIYTLGHLLGAIPWQVIL